MTTGTEGPDNLTNDPNVDPETINALGGDDTITIQGRAPSTGYQDVIVHGGDGYDTLIANGLFFPDYDHPGSGFRVTGENGDYVVIYDGIEKLVLSGSLSISLTTGATEDHLDFTSVQRRGGTISLGAGNDVLRVNATNWSYVNGGDGDDLLVGRGDYFDLFRGDAGNDRIEGGGGNDQIDGGTGADTLVGGTGDDAYWIDNVGDEVIEAAGEGTDKVFSSLSRTTLWANVENLALTGTAVSGYGNGLNNVITGNAEANALYGLDGNDRLDGGEGADRLSGGDGNDTYFVDNEGDRVVESSASGGMDRVYSSVSFNLAYQQIEQLFLTGTAHINATGNSLDNALVGNSGNNILDGGLGADVMNGGDGHDTYIVDNVGDSVIETGEGGIDTVMSSVTFTLSNAYDLENLVLTGTAAINGYGNDEANRITGNSNNNILSGGGGADIMEGGDGNDTYYTSAGSKDIIIESSATGGIDTVYAAENFDLGGQYLENLYLVGAAAQHGFGNSLDNRIYGNSGDNVIDGRAGADFMSGGQGNDVYYVDNAGDRVVEGAGGGDDRIEARVSYDLGGIHVETLVLNSAGALAGTGNSLANTIISRTGGASTLRGLGGDDVLESASVNGTGQHLYGGAGNDTLISIASNKDRFYFDTALDGVNNVDTVLGFDIAGYDQFQLSRGIFKQIDAGLLSEDAFHTGSAAADAEDRIVYDIANGRIFYDADGSGAGAAVLFAQVDPGTQLAYYHFFAY